MLCTIDFSRNLAASKISDSTDRPSTRRNLIDQAAAAVATLIYSGAIEDRIESMDLSFRLSSIVSGLLPRGGAPDTCAAPYRIIYIAPAITGCCDAAVAESNQFPSAAASSLICTDERSPLSWYAAPGGRLQTILSWHRCTQRRILMTYN